jgi:hypothetical protein
VAQDSKGGERDGNFALGLRVHRLPNAPGTRIDPDLLGKNASIAGPLVFPGAPPASHAIDVDFAGVIWERAKAKGVVMGRKPKLTHHQRQEAIARREAGESLVDIGRSYNVVAASAGVLSPILALDHGPQFLSSDVPHPRPAAANTGTLRAWLHL